MKLKLNNSFEDGLSGWHHQQSSPTKWALGKGKTNTPKTGPSFDHTLSNVNGQEQYF